MRAGYTLRRGLCLEPEMSKTAIASQPYRPWYSILYISNATVVIGRWESELDSAKLHEVMAHPMLEAVEAKLA